MCLREPLESKIYFEVGSGDCNPCLGCYKIALGLFRGKLRDVHKAGIGHIVG